MLFTNFLDLFIAATRHAIRTECFFDYYIVDVAIVCDGTKWQTQTRAFVRRKINEPVRLRLVVANISCLVVSRHRSQKCLALDSTYCHKPIEQSLNMSHLFK